MTDGTPENEIEIEKNDEQDEPETENPEETDGTEDDSSEDRSSFRYSSGRPYIRYTSMPRRGSIWNSPIGLAVVGVLVSKGMDLAYRAFIEREKTKRAENQGTVRQSPTKK